MSREELIGKIFQQKEKINNLQDTTNWRQVYKFLFMVSSAN
jgi:hypothetical protein